LDYLIDNYIFEKYLSIFNSNIDIDKDIDDKDIVIFTGGFSVKWDCEDDNLGGSEHSIVELSNSLKNIHNKNIIVYGNFEIEKIVNGIEYKKWFNFPIYKKIKNLIIWRKLGMIMLLNYDFNCNNIMLDLHDSFILTLKDISSQNLSKIFNKIDNFMFKSKYHKKTFLEFLNIKNIVLLNKNYNIIPNGIRLYRFNIKNNYERQQYRFCYCSSYDRGLDIIIEKIWKKIYQHQPLAELHVYYGMDYIYDNNFKINMQYLLGNKGVIDHGRQPIEYIIREKYLSNFHLYITEAISEIDCINIKESAAIGCIPLISNSNVFEERDGIKFEWVSNFDNIANEIILLMENIELSNSIREKLKQSETIKSWDCVSLEWIKLFN
jgi:hypothetical protein